METVFRKVSVKDMPKKNGKYLFITSSGRFITVKWNAFGRTKEYDDVMAQWEKFTHWLEEIELPSEEKINEIVSCIYGAGNDCYTNSNKPSEDIDYWIKELRELIFNPSPTINTKDI